MLKHIAANQTQSYNKTIIELKQNSTSAKHQHNTTQACIETKSFQIVKSFSFFFFF